MIFANSHINYLNRFIILKFIYFYIRRNNILYFNIKIARKYIVPKDNLEQ